MHTNNAPKWELPRTINAGTQAVSLAEANKTDIYPRMKPEEPNLLKESVEELKRRQSGQQEVLTGQKSTTRGQNTAIDILHGRVMGIRNIIRSAPADSEVQKAFGVGEKVNNTVADNRAAANTIIKGYGKFPQAAHDTGVIEADIAEISTLSEALTDADETQETAKFSRKTTTMDKNTLQRTVEDLVSKISAIGMHVYGLSDPAKAKLFEDLIPR